MTIPEFTAETSLYRRGRRYWTRRSGGRPGADVVISQLESTCGTCTCSPGRCCRIDTGQCECIPCAGGLAAEPEVLLRS
jgi:hypothetical protein